eukprot:757338-Hanusia_phi.AAC.1
MHHAVCRGSDVVLVEDAGEKLIAPDRQLALVCVLLVHAALDLAGRLKVDRGNVVQEVDEDGGDQLLARPALDRLHQEGRDRLNLVVGQAELSCEVGEHEKDQLLVLLLREHPVELTDLHAGNDVVLDQASDRAPVRGHNVLEVVLDDASGLSAAKLVLGEMNVDLVPVEVCVVALAVGVVHPDHPLPLVHLHLVRHQTRLVQSRLPVDKHVVSVVEVPSHLPALPPPVLLLQLLCHGCAELRLLLGQVDLVPALVDDVVGSRPDVRPVENSLPQPLHVVLVHRLRPGQPLCKHFWNAHLVVLVSI